MGRKVMVWTTGLSLAALFVLSTVAVAQTAFPGYRAAAQDQYGTPTPTPTATPTTTPAGGNQGQGQGQGQGGNQGGGQGNGGQGNGGQGNGDRPRSGREPSRGGIEDGDGPGAGLAPASDKAGGIPLAQSQGGRLPFTGLDLTLLVLLGILMVAGGCLLKVVQRRGARGDRRA